MRCPAESGIMADPIMLDSSPLGKLAHPTRKPDIDGWFNAILAAGRVLIVPEVADYEVRREFLLAGLARSVDALDLLERIVTYAPITTAVMRKAASLWADARRRGHSTADPKELDADVILAAQALEAGAIVATENVGHLSRYVTAPDWRSIKP